MGGGEFIWWGGGSPVGRLPRARILACQASDPGVPEDPLAVEEERPPIGGGELRIDGERERLRQADAPLSRSTEGSLHGSTLPARRLHGGLQRLVELVRGQPLDSARRRGEELVRNHLAAGEGCPAPERGEDSLLDAVGRRAELLAEANVGPRSPSRDRVVGNRNRDDRLRLAPTHERAEAFPEWPDGSVGGRPPFGEDEQDRAGADGLDQLSHRLGPLLRTARPGALEQRARQLLTVAEPPEEVGIGTLEHLAGCPRGRFPDVARAGLEASDKRGRKNLLERGLGIELGERTAEPEPRRARVRNRVNSHAREEAPRLERVEKPPHRAREAGWEAGEEAPLEHVVAGGEVDPGHRTVAEVAGLSVDGRAEQRDVRLGPVARYEHSARPQLVPWVEVFDAERRPRVHPHRERNGVVQRLERLGARLPRHGRAG